MILNIHNKNNAYIPKSHISSTEELILLNNLSMENFEMLIKESMTNAQRTVKKIYLT